MQITGVGKIPHKTKSARRIITIQEMADYFGVHRHTIRKMKTKWETEGNTLDYKDIYSVLDFVTWYIAQ
jgi:hypothetical protein